MHKKLKEAIRKITPHFVLNIYHLLREVVFNFSRVRIYRKSEIAKILYENWKDCSTDFYPRDRRMDVLKDKGIESMSCENISFIINEIVKRFAKGKVYLEVGSYKGYSLLSAALFNPSTRCIGVDNFSEFDPRHKNESILRENLKKFGSIKNVEFCNCDYKEAFRRLNCKEPHLAITIYYYDGRHLYKDHFEGLALAVDFLCKKCVIIVDDVNDKIVEDANRDFIKKNPDFKSVFKIKTKGNASKGWWNGLEIITRGI